MADLAMPYQFKIWCTESTPLCFIVREDSDIIKRLRVGETVPMKYYSPDAACPWTYHPTKIRNIKRSEQGPFKGHYLVSLEIKAEPDPVVG